MILPDIKAGERFDYTVDSEGRIILRRLTPKPETAERPARLVKLKRDDKGHLRPISKLSVDPFQIARAGR